MLLQKNSSHIYTYGGSILETERQLKDEKIYRPVTFNEKLIEDLTECSKKCFKTFEEGVIYLKRN